MTDLAAVFPGQGSQAVGMLGALAERWPQVRSTFDEASGALGRDLWTLVTDGPAGELDETRWTQPAMLAADVAVWRCYRKAGGTRPAAMAGHSLGEYAALVAAGALGLADATKLVHLRGRLMQEAAGEREGAMAAILGLDDAQVESLCKQNGDGRVVPANYNAPGQLVIAGQRDALERVVSACREAGARRALPLPVSVAAHSPLMAAAADPLRAALAETRVAEPEVPVLHNADLGVHRAPEAIRDALVRQLTAPVPWTATVAALRARGGRRFIECGPGRVLCGLGRRIDRDAHWLALEDPDVLDEAAAGSGKEEYAT